MTLFGLEDQFPNRLPPESLNVIDGPLPLSFFSEERRRAIEEAVARPTPPPRYLLLADGMVQIESRAWHEWHWARGRRAPRHRETTPQWMRERVIERDGNVCQLCGGDVEPDDIHIDHVIPVALGGPTEVQNLQVAHSICNMRKGARI